MNIRLTAVDALILIAMTFPVLAHAGAPHIPCEYPFVFSEAAVNLADRRVDPIRGGRGARNPEPQDVRAPFTLKVRESTTGTGMHVVPRIHNAAAAP